MEAFGYYGADINGLYAEEILSKEPEAEPFGGGDQYNYHQEPKTTTSADPFHHRLRQQILPGGFFEDPIGGGGGTVAAQQAPSAADPLDDNGLYIFQDNPFTSVGNAFTAGGTSIIACRKEEPFHKGGDVSPTTTRPPLFCGGESAASTLSSSGDDPSALLVRRSINGGDVHARPSSSGWQASQQSTVAEFTDGSPYHPVVTASKPIAEECDLSKDKFYSVDGMWPTSEIPDHVNEYRNGSSFDDALGGANVSRLGMEGDGSDWTSREYHPQHHQMNHLPLYEARDLEGRFCGGTTPVGGKGRRSLAGRRKNCLKRQVNMGNPSPSSSSTKKRSSVHSALSEFTSQDENGKRKIKSEVMTVAAELPPLPGLYFDKKQKGFRVRYQNVYVGWVALSKFKSVEEAYCNARNIWENAKCAAEKYHTPQAAIIASIPLQNEAKAAGKNRGGRPRTVTQVPEDERFYETGSHHHLMRNWPLRGLRASTPDEPHPTDCSHLMMSPDTTSRGNSSRLAWSSSGKASEEPGPDYLGGGSGSFNLMDYSVFGPAVGSTVEGSGSGDSSLSASGYLMSTSASRAIASSQPPSFWAEIPATNDAGSLV